MSLRLTDRERYLRDQSEADFQRSVLDIAGRLGWLRFHDHDSRRDNRDAGVDRGFPDTVLVHPDRDVLYLWELKRQTGKPTPEQLRWLEVLSRCRRVECGLYRPADVDEIVRMLG